MARAPIAQVIEEFRHEQDMEIADLDYFEDLLREALGGDAGTESLKTIVRNLTELSQSVNDTAQRSSQNIEAILENVRDVTASMRSATEGESSSFREIVENLRIISGDVPDSLKNKHLIALDIGAPGLE